MNEQALFMELGETYTMYNPFFQGCLLYIQKQLLFLELRGIKHESAITTNHITTEFFKAGAANKHQPPAFYRIDL